MNARPLVSVLIPCFNAEATVAEAIESALGQSHRPLEVVVVDDGSTDGSPAAIKRLSCESLRSVRTANRGGNAARNLLLEHAQGEFVQWLDADDLLLPQKIERQLSAFEDGCDAVLCDYAYRPSGGPDRTVALGPFGADLVAYMVRSTVAVFAPLHRRACLLSAKGFDEQLRCCQEYELHVRLARTVWRKAVHVPEVLAVQRQSPGSVSSREDRVYATMLRLLERWRSELESTGAMTSERTSAISDVAYVCGRHLVRQNEPALARTAFELSRATSPRKTLPARGVLRVMSRCLGPVAAERLRMWLTRWSSDGRKP